MSGTLIFFIVIAVIVLSYGAACLYLLFNQQRLVYEPDRHVSTTPGKRGYDYERIKLTTEDGVNLDAWYLPVKQSLGEILFFHGNTGNMSHRFETIDMFHLLGYSVFMIDYRGYGASEGKPSEQGTFLDAKAAMAYLTQKRGIPESEVIIFGRSLGGAVATWLASQTQAKALVVESSFSAVPDLGKHHYPLFPIELICSYRYESKEHIKHVQVPVLIIHSIEDEFIPFSHGQLLYDNATEPKTLLKMHGNHKDGFVYSGAVYIEGIRHFLNGLS